MNSANLRVDRGRLAHVDYHPHRALRFYRSRPFVDWLILTAETADEMLASGEEAGKLLFASDLIVGRLEPELAMDALPGSVSYVKEECEALELAVGGFFSDGARIFDVSAEAGFLRSTDCDTWDWETVLPPLRSFYLHFGLEAALNAPHSGECVEGCYVDVNDDPQDRHLSFHLVCSGDGFTAQRMGSPGERLRRFARGYSVILWPSDTISAGVKKCQAQEWSFGAPWWRDFIEAPIRVAMQSLFSLNDGNFSVEEAWPRGAPARLIERAEKGGAASRRRAVSDLAVLGFAKVRILAGVGSQTGYGV